MKENTRKHKTDKDPILPKTAYYTLKDFFTANENVWPVEITLRVRHSNMVEEGIVAEIGVLTGGQGRPQKVYALTPITKHVLDKAEANKINLVDGIRKLVNVVSVNSNQSSVNPAAVPSPVTY